jgi:hypothetical protein
VKTGRTDAPTHGRTGLHRRQLRVGWLLAAALCIGASARLSAQETVGVAPDRSPFRDIVDPQSFVVFAGHFAGNGGRAGVGALPGTTFGARLAVRLSGPVDFWATLGQVASTRRVLSAPASADSVRFVGNSKLTLITADVALALNVTGAKTWHRLAPYASIGLGVIAPTRSVTDSGGFRVGVNFLVVPTIGTRLFLSRDIALHVEIRDYYFRYQYPLAFFDIPYAGPPARATVLPITTSSTEWTHNLTLWAGVAYGFTF